MRGSAYKATVILISNYRNRGMGHIRNNEYLLYNVSTHSLIRRFLNHAFIRHWRLSILRD